MKFDKALNSETALNEYMPAQTIEGQIAQLTIVTVGFLAMFIISGAPSAIIDAIVLAIKNRKISSGKVGRMVQDMKDVGIDPKKLTDSAHIAIFTKAVSKLTKAKSEAEAEAAEKQLRTTLSDLMPYQRGRIRGALSKVSKENKINLAHKVKYFFGLEG